MMDPKCHFRIFLGYFFWIFLVINNIYAFDANWSDKIFGPRSSTTTPRSLFLASTPRHSPTSSSISSSSFASNRNSFWPQSPINSMNAFQSFQPSAPSNSFQRHHYSSRFPPINSLPPPYMHHRTPVHHFLQNFQQLPPTIRPTPAPFDWVKELIQNRLIESRNNLNQVQESLARFQPSVTTTTTTSTTRRPNNQYQIVMDHIPPPNLNPDPSQNQIQNLDLNSNNNNNENRIEVDYADQLPEIRDENLDYYDHDAARQSSLEKDSMDEAKILSNHISEITKNTPTQIESLKPKSEKIQEQKVSHAAQLLDSNSSSNDSWIQDSFEHLAREIKEDMDRAKSENNESENEDNDFEFERQAKSLGRRSQTLELEHPLLQSLDAINDDSNFNSNSNTTWSFRCPDNVTGYFADLSNDCQSYYHCSGHRRERFRFTCPLGTKFNERSSNCDWEDNVDCHQKFDLLRA